jgi:hypothetical protein
VAAFPSGLTGWMFTTTIPSRREAWKKRYGISRRPGAMSAGKSWMAASH